MLPSNVRTVCALDASLPVSFPPPSPFGVASRQGLGSIKVGGPSQWRKEPSAPARDLESEEGSRNAGRGPLPIQAPYKSIKDQMKDRAA